jgi:protein-S-isoprenylcysteine O-methyltransferase Ste14
MKMRKDSNFLFTIVLGIVFTVALIFATLEIPRAVNRTLLVLFPDLYWEVESIEEFMGYARPIGYASLAIVVAVIIIGFASKKKRVSSLGSIVLFLPTFGYFAGSMFFLAGIGILRVLWIPLWDLSPQFMKLGDIAYLPYIALVYPFSLVGLDVRTSLSSLAIGAGFLIFFLGTATWLYGKSKGLSVVDFWIYKQSRHPQYFGFLVWSYGIMLLASLASFPKGGYNPGPSLTWLLSALIIICMALREEVVMIKKHGEGYLRYRERTPFMVPLPKVISAMLTAPIRILLRKDLPESGKELAFTFLVYTGISILLSFPFLLLNWPPGYGWVTWPSA